MTETPETLAAALAALQRKLPQIKKSERADAGNYSYTYADLASVSSAVMPLLGEQGLSFSARPTLNEAREFVLAYELLHVSGENRCGEYPLPSGGTPQVLGSAITYGRRYVLCALTGVAPEDDDDDAQAAQEHAKQAKPDRRRGKRATPDDDPWYVRTEADVGKPATDDPLKALKKDIWTAAKQAGLGTKENLEQDFAMSTGGLILGEANEGELRSYLGLLQSRLEEAAKEPEVTEEPPL